MKKIAILGNSLTAVKIIEQLKSFGEDVEAVFISSENTFPYYRNLLPELPSKKINQNKVFYRPAAEYEAEKIKFIFDKKPTRVNFKRGRVTLDDKEQIDYDYLIISDIFEAPFHNVKGDNKTGLYHLRRLTDMSDLLKAMPFIETIAVRSDNLAGLKTAVSLCAAKKEVILVTSEPRILNGLLEESNAMVVQTALEEIGLRIFTQNKITELLGDSEAKAIRLEGGKVLACQAVLTDSDLLDLRLFKETELQYSQRVRVNEAYQANFENVFAIDTVCDRMIFSDWDMADNSVEFAQEQARAIASRITGKEYVPAVAPFAWTITIGQTPFKFSASSSLSMLQLQREETPVAA